MLKLIGTDGEKYYAWDLSPGRYRIGRTSECDLSIPHATVSRSHAELYVLPDGRQCFVTDLGSHNGTLVNGVRLSERTAAKAGDSIVFGRAELRLTSDQEETVRSSHPTGTVLSDLDPKKSVYLSINEALKPLPSKVTDLPGLLPTLSEMARLLLPHEPREVMLQKSLELVSRVIPAERLAVLFTSEDDREIYAAATLLPGGKDPGTFTLSRTIVNDILTEKSAVVISDPQTDPRYALQQSIVASSVRSAMAAPLFDEGKVLGILYADTTNPMHRYDDDYLRLLATFGNIIASRLLSHTLLQEREEKRVIEAELRRASQIQQRLLVSGCPRLPGYSVYAFQEQCRMVGGDLYEMATLPDGRFLFLVGDVSGKGMGAALLMSNILASFRILYGEEDFDLHQAMLRVSRQLYVYSDSDDFATMFAGLLDPAANRLTYINAGHNPPLIVGRDGLRRQLEACGIMIGAFDFDDWQPAVVDVSPGDVLLVYTDGVTEAERGETQYGEERMTTVLVKAAESSPKDIARMLIEDIRDFAQNTPQSDDITMLLLKRDT
ncbi:MAG TPA: SpoIIE family protein phosphatase [Acidobacteriota bacterium]|nr:SpoIIE family protein phosphatase [Acidobacteriota bacterium]